ncbi:hypothetical protein EDB19DRAFT_1874603 [Suillus lakei]|nr:hypothetical protein EDB19DRAFT_1874603 [Suillus lakei]
MRAVSMTAITLLNYSRSLPNPVHEPFGHQPQHALQPSMSRKQHLDFPSPGYAPRIIQCSILHLSLTSTYFAPSLCTSESR